MKYTNIIYLNVFFSNIIYTENECECLIRVLNDHIAMLNEQTAIQYEIRVKCPKPEDYQIELLRMCKKTVRNTGHAWATQLSAPYTHALNRHASSKVRKEKEKKTVAIFYLF